MLTAHRSWLASTTQRTQLDWQQRNAPLFLPDSDGQRAAAAWSQGASVVPQIASLEALGPGATTDAGDEPHC
jgi:hypothetical protein